MKDNLYIYIPTRGRLEKQATLKKIPEKWIPYTRLVVGEEEADSHIEKYGKELIMISPIEGLSAKRQWIMENAHSRYLLFLDDDLRFYTRNGNTSIASTEDDMNDLFNLIFYWISDLKYAHAGLSSKSHQFHYICETKEEQNPKNYIEIGKMWAAYGYNVDIFEKENIKFDRLPLMQDFDVTLSLLERGYPNRITYKYAHDQVGGSGSPGGCAFYRTNKLMKETAYKLEKLHPGVVDVVLKTSKTKWKGLSSNTRVDVNIHWKNAYRKKIGNISGFLK